MDSSSMFFDWAMETLQQEDLHQPDAASYAVLEGLLQNSTAPAAAGAAAQDRATDSWSSGDSGTRGGAVVENDGCPPSSYPLVRWHYTSTMAQPTIHEAPAREPDVPEPAHGSPLSRKNSAKSAASSSVTTGQTSSPEPGAKEHARSERKRRETINRGFIELSSVIPGLKKMDKTTILFDAVRYVKDQQEKLKKAESRSGKSVDSSVVLAKSPRIATVPGGASATTTTSSLPEIEAKKSESDVMVRIHCDDGKGVLVRLLAEVEELHLSITHTNVIPCFPACTLNITIMAKVDEGFNIAPEDIVEKLAAALRGHI